MEAPTYREILEYLKTMEAKGDHHLDDICMLWNKESGEFEPADFVICPIEEIDSDRMVVCSLND